VSFAVAPVLATCAWTIVLLAFGVTELVRDGEPAGDVREFFRTSGLVGISLATISCWSLVALTAIRIAEDDIPNRLGYAKWVVVVMELAACTGGIALWCKRRRALGVCVLAAGIVSPPLVTFWWMFVGALPFFFAALRALRLASHGR
jgi:hypothetical protein